MLVQLILYYNEKTNKLIIGDYKRFTFRYSILTNIGWVNMGDLTLQHKVYLIKW